MSTIYAHMFQKDHNSNCSEKAFFRDDREKAFVPFSMQLLHKRRDNAWVHTAVVFLVIGGKKRF